MFRFIRVCLLSVICFQAPVGLSAVESAEEKAEASRSSVKRIRLKHRKSLTTEPNERSGMVLTALALGVGTISGVLSYDFWTGILASSRPRGVKEESQIKPAVVVGMVIGTGIAAYILWRWAQPIPKVKSYLDYRTMTPFDPTNPTHWMKFGPEKPAKFNPWFIFTSAKNAAAETLSAIGKQLAGLLGFK